MTVSPSLFHAELAAGRRSDDRRRVVTHRVVRPDARPRRGPIPRAHTAAPRSRRGDPADERVMIAA